MTKGTINTTEPVTPVTIRTVETYTIRADGGGGGSAGGAGNAADEAKRPKPRFDAVKEVRSATGEWTSGEAIVLNGPRPDSLLRRFRVVSLNHGNAPFSGDVILYDRLPSGVTFANGVTAASVHDNRSTKQGLGIIPVLGIFALAIKDLSTIQQLSPEITADPTGLLTFRLGQLTLRSNDGIVIEFDVQLPKPSSLSK